MATHIVLIRHAATETSGRLCGSYDAPLSVAGRRQVQALLERPAARPAPDAVFTSTLSRATITAAALARAWGLAPRHAEWAREIHCGHVEGMPLELVQRNYPDVWARNEAQTNITFAWPGGETYAQFRSRIVSGLQEASSRHEGGRVVVVTHTGVISQVLGVFRNRPPSVWNADRPAPFTATELVWQNGGPIAVLTFNELGWY